MDSKGYEHLSNGIKDLKKLEKFELGLEYRKIIVILYLIIFISYKKIIEIRIITCIKKD